MAAPPVDPGRRGRRPLRAAAGPTGAVRRATLALVVSCLLAGCASTRVETAGRPLAAPLCEPGVPPVRTLFFWRPQWRPDQKEPALREAAALRGLEAFASHAGCLEVVGIRRLPTAAGEPDDEALRALAGSAVPPPDRLVLVVVRELGPRLVVGTPALIEGGTEVAIDMRVLGMRPAESLADVRASWRHGGAFVIRGVGSLDRDMRDALGAVLMPTKASR